MYSCSTASLLRGWSSSNFHCASLTFKVVPRKTATAMLHTTSSSHVKNNLRKFHDSFSRSILTVNISMSILIKNTNYLGGRSCDKQWLSAVTHSIASDSDGIILIKKQHHKSSYASYGTSSTTIYNPIPTTLTFT